MGLKAMFGISSKQKYSAFHASANRKEVAVMELDIEIHETNITSKF